LTRGTLPATPEVPLTELGQLSAGYHFRRAIGDYPAGSQPVLQVTDLDADGRFELGRLSHIEPDFDPAPHRLDRGDVLFLARGARNWAQTITDGAGVIVPAYFYILRPNVDRVDSRYLSFWLGSSRIRRQIASARQGTNVRFITLGDFRTLTVPLPLLAIQRQIGELHQLSSREYAITTRLRDARASLADALALVAASGQQ
jgi:hypothetical protein